MVFGFESAIRGVAVVAVVVAVGIVVGVVVAVGAAAYADGSVAGSIGALGSEKKGTVPVDGAFVAAVGDGADAHAVRAEDDAASSWPVDDDADFGGGVAVAADAHTCVAAFGFDMPQTRRVAPF